jgi:hypothetical protein
VLRPPGARPTAAPRAGVAHERREPFEPEGLSSGLAERVEALCEAVLDWLEPDDEAREDLQRELVQLAEPLRVAVVGPTGAGRSSLVDALLGSRVARGGDPALAAADLSFAYGTPERIEVTVSDPASLGTGGQTIKRGLLPDGTLPVDLVPPASEVVSAWVWLPVQTLRTLTLIDSRATPSGGAAGGPGGAPSRAASSASPSSPAAPAGAPSPSAQSASPSSPAAPASAPSRAEADAFLFAWPVDPAADASAMRATLDAALGGARASAVNTAAVLTHVDALADAAPGEASPPDVGPDGEAPPGGTPPEASPAAAPAEASPAEAEAARLTAALGPRVAAVVPCDARLAESVNTSGVDAADLELLTRLAALSPEERAPLLASAEAFTTGAAPLAAEERERLLLVMGLNGVRAALPLLDAAPITVVGLVRRLRELSGIERVARELDGFHLRADVLKAGRSLTRLEALSYRWPQLAFLRDRVETLRLDPEMHVLDLLAAFDRCATGETELPSDLMTELTRLVTARTPAQRLGLADDAADDDLRAAARSALRAWKIYENGSQAPPSGRRVARVVARSYEILATQGPTPDAPAA